MQCLLLSSKNTHWISLNDSNTGLLPWQQAKKYMSIQGQSNFLTLAQGHLHIKIKTCFSQKPLDLF